MLKLIQQSIAAKWNDFAMIFKKQRKNMTQISIQLYHCLLERSYEDKSRQISLKVKLK